MTPFSAAAVRFFSVVTCFCSDLTCAASDFSVGPLLELAPAGDATSKTMAAMAAIATTCFMSSSPLEPRLFGPQYATRSAREQRALELEQRALAVEPAGVADERARGADDTVARQHDRDGVPVHDRADGAGCSGAAGALGERAVGRQLAVRDARELVEHGAAELAGGAEVDLVLEVAPRAGEGLVALEGGLVGRRRRAEHARAEEAGEALGLGFRVGVVVDLADATAGDRDEQLADRGLVQLVGDVEQAFRGGGVAEPAVERGGDGHESSFFRSRRTPDDAAWR